MDIFDQLESIYKDTQSIVVDCTNHLEDDFVHYKVDSIEDWNCVKNDLATLMSDSCYKLDCYQSQNTLETAMQNYLYFFSENNAFFQDNFSEDIMNGIKVCDPVQYKERVETVHTSTLSSDDDLDAYLKKLTKDLESRELLHEDIPPIDVNFESVNIDADDKGSASKENNAKVEINENSKNWTLEDVEEMLKDLPNEMFTHLSHDEYNYKSSDNEVETELKNYATPLKPLSDHNNKHNDTMVHSILKSSSRFVSYKLQNATPRVKFNLDKSSSESIDSSEKLIKAYKSKSKTSKENISMDLFSKANFKMNFH